jgi:hypothetical protein
MDMLLDERSMTEDVLIVVKNLVNVSTNKEKKMEYVPIVVNNLLKVEEQNVLSVWNISENTGKSTTMF